MKIELSMKELERVNGGDGFWDQLILDAIVGWQEFKEDVGSITWKDVGDAVFNCDDEWWV